MQKNKLIIISLSIIIIIIFFALFVVYLQSNNYENEDTIISAQDFSETIETEINETEKTIFLNFKDLEDGDKITIKNSIDYMKYWEDLDYTAIEFQVNTTLDNGEQVSSLEFDIQGNITDTYKKDDLVQLTFTIKNVKFEHENWSYDLEVYEEAYDQEFYINNSFTQILPQSCIKKL
jgi:hypothetical protein